MTTTIAAPAMLALSGFVLKYLIHGAGWLRATGLADDFGRNTGDRDIVWHRLHHHRACGDAGTMANLDIAEDFGAGANHHAVADLRMPVLPFLAGAAQCHVVQHRHIVADFRGFTDDKASGVIEENATADFRGRMDIALEHYRASALQIEREISAVLLPKPMRQPVGLNGMKALVVEHRLDQPMGRRIAVRGGHQIGAEDFAEGGNILERI